MTGVAAGKLNVPTAGQEYTDPAGAVFFLKFRWFLYGLANHLHFLIFLSCDKFILRCENPESFNVFITFLTLRHKSLHKE